MGLPERYPGGREQYRECQGRSESRTDWSFDQFDLSFVFYLKGLWGCPVNGIFDEQFPDAGSVRLDIRLMCHISAREMLLSDTLKSQVGQE